MKIATVTYQRHDNIGAMLQCYALQQSIRKLGHENEIIDYICDAADRPFCLKSFKVKGVKKYITSIIGVISRIPKKPSFIKFRKNFLTMTRKVDKKNVGQFSNLYDGYIVGSDNVWNSKLTGLDINYFFAFVDDDYKKASYAASLGMGEIPTEEKKEFKKWLNKFNFITTREEKAADSLSILLERKVADTCDPTFLLTSDDWDKISVPVKMPKSYVLVYQMSPSYSFVKFAKSFAKKKGLPIVYVPFPYGPCKCSPKAHIGPCEWLTYVKNAEYVITDSFHGCVFSSIYERNLIIKISQLGDRIKNLTQKLGMPERIVETVEEAIALPKLNYKEIRTKIANYRSEGLETLTRLINSFPESK